MSDRESLLHARDRLGNWLMVQTGYPVRRWARWRWVSRLAQRLDPYRDEVEAGEFYE